MRSHVHNTSVLCTLLFLDSKYGLEPCFHAETHKESRVSVQWATTALLFLVCLHAPHLISCHEWIFFLVPVLFLTPHLRSSHRQPLIIRDGKTHSCPYFRPFLPLHVFDSALSLLSFDCSFCFGSSHFFFVISAPLLAHFRTVVPTTLVFLVLAAVLFLNHAASALPLTWFSLFPLCVLLLVFCLVFLSHSLLFDAFLTTSADPTTHAPNNGKASVMSRWCDTHTHTHARTLRYNPDWLEKDKKQWDINKNSFRSHFFPFRAPFL